MFCQNCGSKLEEGTKFCTNCGAKQDDVQQQAAPVQTPVQTSVETPIQTSVPESNTQPVQEPVQPTTAEQPVNPVNAAAEPVANPQPYQYGSTPNQYPAQPVPQAENKTGFVSKLKQINPKIYIFGGIGILLVIAIIVVSVNIISNSGVKGVLNHMEKAINNQDIDQLEKCYPDFVWESMDIDDEDEITSTLSIGSDVIDVSFSLEDETDVTDEDYSSSETWQEYAERTYGYYDEYDDEEVEAVVEAEISAEYDFGSSIANSLVNSIADTSEDTTTMHFVKLDGSWYILSTY
jgi:hypothetical protein